MPRLPIDYSKAFIYKICCKDKNIEECYIGSSTNFVKRKNHHKTSCNNINRKEYNQKKYVFIRENGGWTNWEMVLIHNFPCENKRQLEKEEEHIRREYQYNINSIKAYRTKEEKIEYQKQYRDDNKEKIAENQKQYQKDNKEKIAENQKQYRDDNKERIAKYRDNNKDKIAQYYNDNKERITEHRKQKIKCDCGSVISLGNISTHKKSNKHMKLIENLIQCR